MPTFWPDRLRRPSPHVLLVAAVAVLGLAALGAGAWYWHGEQERRANGAYAAALARLANARGPEAAADRATAARELETALASYPSSAMAAQAAFELGGLRYGDRQYAAARAAWTIALARAGSNTLRTLARLSIAATWEAERDFPKAIDAYRGALAEMKPNEFQFEETLIDLARVQELGGHKDEAIQSYRRLLKDVPNTRRAEDVRVRLASLGATP
jgi:tetratricopeptide (TPR) repeat protein